MSVEKNNNSELLHGSDEQSKLLEQKQALQKELQDLKTLNTQIENQQSHEKQAEKSDLISKEIGDQLEHLAQRVDALDAKNTNRFLAEVKKIEDQIETIKKTRDDLRSLQKTFSKADPSQLQSTVQEQLPDHDPKANAGRVSSIENILNILPKEGETSVANRAARRIQELVK